MQLVFGQSLSQVHFQIAPVFGIGMHRFVIETVDPATRFLGRV